MSKQKRFTISVIIPTLNRPDDMARLLPTILAQTLLPNELIIVDQSVNDATKNIVTPLSETKKEIKLNYIHDSSFNGLVKAKEIGARVANGDIVCFLDDDTTLDIDYFNAIKQGFIDNKKMLGCSSMINNSIKKSLLYLYAHRFFHQGIFYDPRPMILANLAKNSPALINCDLLSGGASCWKKEVLSNIPFDKNGIHTFEDSDYSSRAVDQYGHHFYLNNKAKIQHYPVQDDRPNMYAIQQRKVMDAFVFYKKRLKYFGAIRGIFFLLAWWFIENLILVFQYKTISPIMGYFSGIIKSIQRNIIKN